MPGPHLAWPASREAAVVDLVDDARDVAAEGETVGEYPPGCEQPCVLQCADTARADRSFGTSASLPTVKARAAMNFWRLRTSKPTPSPRGTSKTSRSDPRPTTFAARSAATLVVDAIPGSREGSTLGKPLTAHFGVCQGPRRSDKLRHNL